MIFSSLDNSVGRVLISTALFSPLANSGDRALIVAAAKKGFLGEVYELRAHLFEVYLLNFHNLQFHPLLLRSKEMLLRNFYYCDVMI